MGHATTKLPVYDDFGNPVQVPVSSRTYERRHGCWNCIHADAGDDYLKRVDEVEARNVNHLTAQGRTYDSALRQAAVERKTMIKLRGFHVLCKAGKVEGDFVSCKHLCDHWSGRPGAYSPGGGVDKLVEELYDDLGEKPGGEPK